MATVRHVTIAAALLLSACNQGTRKMPNLQDRDAVIAAVESLSPWKDGSPDRSRDKRTHGDESSDRQVFLRWLRAYENHETYRQHDRDYEPAPVPATLEQAIAEQRQRDQQQAARVAEQAQRYAEQDQRDAEGDRIAALARQQEDEQRLATQAAEQSKAVEAETAATIKQSRTDAETEARQQADLQCRDRRSEAENKASLDPTDPQAAIARVRSSMRCGSDGPPS